MQSEVTGCKTFGGHGEQMAVFGSKVKVAGRNLTDIIGTDEFPVAEWEQMRKDVIQAVPRSSSSVVVLLSRARLTSQLK